MPCRLPPHAQPAGQRRRIAERRDTFAAPSLIHPTRNAARALPTPPAPRCDRRAAPPGRVPGRQ
jgi:hypothetical protein